MRLNSKERLSLVRSVLYYKREHEPKFVQNTQRKMSQGLRDFGRSLVTLPRDNFEVIRIPYAASIKKLAAKEIEELLTFKTSGEDGYDRYISAMEALTKVTGEKVQQDKNGNFIYPLSGQLFSGNRSGLPVEIEPGLKVMSSKGQWVKAPGEGQPVFLHVSFDLFNEGKPEILSTEFNTGIQNVTEIDANDISENETMQSLKTALGIKLPEILNYRREHSDSLAQNGFLEQELGKLPYTNGFLAKAEFKLIHDLDDKNSFLLKAYIPFEVDSGQTVIYEVNFNLNLKDGAFEIVESA